MSSGARGNPQTAERLVAAAVELFAQKWYATVSVAEICREAGLSNGVFYRYFEGKEALFKLILGRVLEQIREAMEQAGGQTPRERIQNYSAAMLRYTEAHADLISVFREGQYRYFDFERRLVAIYTRSLSTALGREVDLAEYLFAFGGLRFCSIRGASGASSIDLDTVTGIVTDGLFRGLSFDAAKVFGGSACRA